EADFTEAIEEIIAAPPTEEELARALADFEKSAYAALTPPLMRAFALVIGFAQNDDPAYYKKDFSRYFQVTPLDLQRVAKRYLTPEKVVLWTLPADSEHPKSPATIAGPNLSAPDRSASPHRLPESGPDWSKMPGPSAALSFKAPRFVRKTLPNGLEVWVAPWKTLPLVTVRLLMAAGTADDPDGKSGLASLTATLLTQGTKSRTATELAEAFEALGVTLGARASVDETSTGFSTVTRHLDPALKLLGEVLTSPRFDPVDFERERSLQIASLAQGAEDPNWIARRAFPVLLYGEGHPYANPGDGYDETLKGLRLEDVRAFHSRRLGPKGAIMVVVGDVEPEAAFSKVEDSLGGWNAQEVAPSPRPEATVKARPGVVHFVDKPGTVQSVVNVGRRWLDRSDESYFATLVGNRILGGDFLSRLNQNLREKNGFTYGANSAFRFRRTGSVWSVSTQVRTDATAPALKEALNELDALAGGKPFTVEEIETAVGAEVKSFPEGFDSPGSIAGILEEMARFKLPLDHLDTYLARLQATTPVSIGQAMARVIQPEERVVLIVGDRASVEPKLRTLGYDRIESIDYNGRPVR
ncbi:MAG: insulinase family protein, partial [Isosphaeraceae bacterium]